MKWACCARAGWQALRLALRALNTGSFRRSFTYGHVRQMDAVASRFLAYLAARTPMLGESASGYTFVEVDDTIIEVHGYDK